MQYVYENKKTGERIVRSEKLDGKYWKKIGKVGEWRNAQMKSNEIKKK